MSRAAFHARVASAALAWGTLALSGCREPGPEFGPVQTLFETGGSNPTVAADPTSGRAYVTWVGGVHAAHGGPTDVWLVAVDAEGGFGTPVRVNDLPGDAAPHLQAPAQVSVGPEGNVYVAWTNNAAIEGRRFPSSNLRFARSTDGGRTFEPAITVNDDVGGIPSSNTFHNVLAAPDGSVLVTWLDSRREWNPEGVQGWDSHAGAHPFDATLPGPDVRVAISRDGGRTFEPSRIVDQQTCPCCRTALAVGREGEIHVSWRKIFPGDIRDIVVSTSRDGGHSFGEPRKVAPDDWHFPGCPHAGPSLAVDEAGLLHVVWYTGRERGPGLYYATSSDQGQTFTSATPLLTDAWVPPSQSALAVEAGGRLWVAWEDRRPDTPAFRLTSFNPGERPDPGSGTPFTGGNPALGALPGRLTVAWLEGERVRAQTVVTP